MRSEDCGSEQMKGKHLSARTAYLALGSRECLSFISAQPPHEGEAGNRVGCIRTVDGGLSFEFLSWDYLSTVKITEPHSNPPALLKLADGRLCCGYGDRIDSRIKVKYSDDDGHSWGPEVIIRHDYYQCHESDRDLGYVSMVQRPDGKLVAIYYWAAAEHPQQYIAASIWGP